MGEAVQKGSQVLGTFKWFRWCMRLRKSHRFTGSQVQGVQIVQVGPLIQVLEVVTVVQVVRGGRGGGFRSLQKCPKERKKRKDGCSNCLFVFCFLFFLPHLPPHADRINFSHASRNADGGGGGGAKRKKKNPEAIPQPDMPESLSTSSLRAKTVGHSPPPSAVSVSLAEPPPQEVHPPARREVLSAVPYFPDTTLA